MKTRVMAMLLVLFAATVGMAAEPRPADGNGATDARFSTARTIAASFAGELRAALEKALGERGPAGAISVCKDEAPAIAARLSAQHLSSVRRTGVRVRNPANSPQPWELAVLKDFQARLGSGRRAEELEFFEARADGGARYMKAIAVQPLCVVCHGENIAPDVSSAISKGYPSDQATGFKVGDLRGAFSIEWPGRTRDAR
jgi:hypothetical protein